jgi:hypothetical protein
MMLGTAFSRDDFSMDWDAIRSRIMVFLVADALGFAIFWLHRALGTPSGRLEELLLLALGISNGIIVFAAIAACILMIPAAVARTVQAWMG